MAKLAEPIRGPGTDEFATPQSLFDHYNKVFGFTLDVAATPRNKKCRRFFSKRSDGLKQEWSGTVWMNPPYSQLGHWVKKAYVSSMAGATVVGLIPAWTDAKWFQDSCMHAEIQLLRGRVSFDNRPGYAPFSSMIVIWRPDDSFMRSSCVAVPMKDEDAAKAVQPYIRKKPTNTPVEAAKPIVIRTIADIVAEDKVSAAKAKRIQDQEILAVGRVIEPVRAVAGSRATEHIQPAQAIRCHKAIINGESA